jgi:hypothetical protein
MGFAGVAEGARICPGRLLAVPGWAELRRTWRVSSSYDAVSANDG